MSKLFQFFVVVLALFWCTTLLAQQKGDINSEADISPNQNSTTVTGEDVIWDLLFSFDVTLASGAAGNAGAEFANGFYYTTRWASNLIHEYDMTGALVREFSIPGVTGLRDLAYDGTYFYGGASGATIYQMDFATTTLIGTIPVGGGITVRNIAYDEAADGFWCGNWADPISLIPRAGGAPIAQIATGLISQYGCAYDNVSPGGPFLWVFDQTAGTEAIIHQFDIASGTATGVTHNAGLDAIDPTIIAGGLWTSTDHTTGFLVMGALGQGVPDEMLVYEIAVAGPPCPVGAPDNPTPVNGATDVPINLAQVSWDNGAGTLFNEVYFGEAGNMQQVYTGSAVTSYAIPGPLSYDTGYQWKVICQNDTCGVSGPTWTFTTVQDPLLVIDTICVYPQSAAYWTGTTDGSAKTDTSEVRCVNLEDGWMMFDVSAITDAATIIQITFYGYVNNTYYPWWSATPLPGINPLTATASELKTAIEANSAQGVAYVYANETSSFATGWHDYLMETWTNTDLQAALAQDWFAMGMDSRDNSTTYWINWDGWAEANVPYLCVVFEWIIPVELTSFTASTGENQVTLNWVTASEINNLGFEIQRSSNGEFVTVGFVEGHGTTTEIQNYSYTDREIPEGSYGYRLKQVDYNGTFEYSDVVEVDVTSPKEFALYQNYPNPFNPNTNIEFSIAVDSKVSLKIYDILGQEVVSLISSDITAGLHKIDFDASNLNSGVYFYRLDAQGIDGSTFTLTRKMILTK